MLNETQPQLLTRAGQHVLIVVNGFGMHYYVDEDGTEYLVHTLTVEQAKRMKESE